MDPTMTIPRFDELVHKYQIKADKINGVAIEAVDVTTKWALKKMIKKVIPHKKTGEALDALKREPATDCGNYIQGKVGALDISKGKKNEKGLHVIFQEHGSPTFPKDPFYEPVIKQKSQMRKLQEEVFKRRGYL